MRSARTQELRAKYEAATDLPLLVLAATMIPVLLAPVIWDLNESAEAVLLTVDWFIWAVFAVDYFTRLAMADSRRRYVVREWPNLLIVIIPFLRPLRIVRSARALRLLRLVRVAAFAAENAQQVRRVLTRHNLGYSLLFTAGIVVGAGALVTAVEDGSGGSIDSLPDGLWWAATTVTTVGYGDTFPVTAAGRGVAVALMLAGIALFGVIAANLAAVMIQPDDPVDLNRISHQLEAIAERLAEIERRMDVGPRS
jgi:voltage-gated potassium channel